LEVCNPGGLYGRIRIDQLGKTQPDTRNPVLAVAMEVLNKTENRYSGIPTICRELEKAGMPEPVFNDIRGNFSVCFYKDKISKTYTSGNKEMQLLEFCEKFRTRQEIADFLGIKTVPHAIKNHIMPLVDEGLIELEFPEKPRSSKQRYKTR